MYYFSLFTAALALIRASAALPEKSEFNGPQDPRRFHYYDLPTPGAGPCDMCTGPNGKDIWYQDLRSNKVGVVYTNNGSVEDFPIPSGPGYTDSSSPFVGNRTATTRCAVRLGLDGNIYGVSSYTNQMFRVNPVTKEIKLFAPPQGPSGELTNFNDGWPASDGIYFSKMVANSVLFFHYRSHKWKSFIARTPESGPLSMRLDDEGNLWFTEFFTQKLARLDPQTGNVTEIPVKQPGGMYPDSFRTLTQGRYLWANAFGAGGFIRIDTKSLKMKVFRYPGGNDSFPLQNDSDNFGRVWFSSYALNSLVYYDPATKEWTTIKLGKEHENASADTKHRYPPTVPVHNGPLNSMWFTHVAGRKIGRYVYV